MASPSACRPAFAGVGRILVDAVLTVVVVVTLAWPSTPAAASPAFRMPIPSATVTRGFDPPAQRWQTGHRGVDLSAPPGAEVRAAGPGTVAFAGEIAGRPVISIRHADGLVTTYEPVQARVRRGQAVTRGTVIGTLLAGHPGCTATACLHWGARRGSGHAAVYLNPLALVGGVRVRLKPVERGSVTRADVPAGARPAVSPR